jgi:type III secretory pathway component EscR
MNQITYGGAIQFNRVLMLRTQVIEMVISGVLMTLGIFMVLPMNASSFGISLLGGAGLLVAGIIAFLLTIKAIFKYYGR